MSACATNWWRVMWMVALCTTMPSIMTRSSVWGSRVRTLECLWGCWWGISNALMESGHIEHSMSLVYPSKFLSPPVHSILSTSLLELAVLVICCFSNSFSRQKNRKTQVLNDKSEDFNSENEARHTEINSLYIEEDMNCCCQTVTWHQPHSGGNWSFK